MKCFTLKSERLPPPPRPPQKNGCTVSAVTSAEGREGGLEVEVRHFNARFKAGEADVDVVFFSEVLADGPGLRAAASRPGQLLPQE